MRSDLYLKNIVVVVITPNVHHVTVFKEKYERI